ncbi:MAG: DNA primase, partial [Acholeplasmatales bacterium]|nr:DNA primase [Acholeplasmatales bacterium]
MASQHEIDSVIEATDIVALVSEYVKLEKTGKNYKGLCPFHNEDTPSFVVSPEKRIAHCFGCGGGGSPIKFLQDIEHIDFPTALSRLAKRNGVTISNFKEDKKTNNYAKFYAMMQTSSEFYIKNFENTKSGLEAREYLNKRGLDDETIKVFDIGLAPSNSNSLYNVLKDSSYLELDMMDLGLVGSNDKGYYDLFIKRIMFPIKNENGNVIAFSGRIYNSTDPNSPKYVNTKETFIFKKGSTLFNLNIAKGEIMKKKRVILHEGQMDVIASYRSGLKEAICTLGTALTLEQVKILKKYTNQAIICYDGEKAGINASLKAIKLFKANGFNVGLVMLPDGMDPDEYTLKFGSEAYKSYFESHIVDSNTYIFEQAFINKNLDDVIVKDHIKDEVFAMLSTVESQTLVEEFLDRLAKRLNVSLAIIKNDYSKYYTSANYNNYVEPSVGDKNYYDEPYNNDYAAYDDDPFYTNVKPKRINQLKSMCEYRLINYAISSKDRALTIDERISDHIQAFSKENQNIWFALINNYYHTYDEFNYDKFIKLLSPEDLNHFIIGLEKLRNDKANIYDDIDLENCIRKIQEMNCDVSNSNIDKSISTINNQELQAKLILEKFKNKKKK